MCAYYQQFSFYTHQELYDFNRTNTGLFKENMICVHFINGTASTRTRSCTTSTRQTQARLERKWYVCIHIINSSASTRTRSCSTSTGRTQARLERKLYWYILSIVQLPFSRSYTASTGRTQVRLQRKQYVYISSIVQLFNAVGGVQRQPYKHRIVQRETNLCTFYHQYCRICTASSGQTNARLQIGICK